jgi:hypothetical protein
MAKNEYYVEGSEPQENKPVRRKVHVRQHENRVTVMIDEICLFEIYNSGEIERWNFCRESGVEVDAEYSRPVIHDR